MSEDPVVDGLADNAGHSVDQENLDSQKTLAKAFIHKLLHSTYRGTLIYEGYFKSQEKNLLEMANPLTDESSGDEVEQVDEGGKQDGDEDFELVYVPEKKTGFNPYQLVTIVMENEFFLKKFR